MSKKLIWVFVGVIFFVSCSPVFANVVINEVRVVNGEFVELYNSGSTDVPLTNYYFAYYSSSRTNWNNPYRSQKFPDSSVIKGQSFYVIALGQYTSQFDWQPYTSNQLSDTDGTVALWSDNPTANTSQLLDAFGWGKVSLSEGQSFSLPVSISSGDSFGRVPDGADTNNNSTDFNLTLATPGATNQLDTTSSTTTTASTTSDTTTDTTVVVGGSGGVPADYSGRDSAGSSSTSSQSTQTQTQKIKTQIVAKTLNFVGLPVAFQANSFGVNGEKLYFGKYFWNFGDGDSKEMSLTDPEPFNHIYYYPGDYLVSLDYYQNAYGGDIAPDATNQIDIKIIPADISISSVGDDKDFFVEITNNTDYSADISGWILQSAQKSFIFPRDTIILSKQKMTISPKITNFSVVDESTLKLVDPAGNTVFDYSAPIATNTNMTTIATTTAVVPDKPTLAQQPKESTAAYVNETIPPVKSLTATALSGNVSPNTSVSNSSSKKTTIFIVSFLFIGVAAYAVYFIRRKKFMVNSTEDSVKAGNDFEILDE